MKTGSARVLGMYDMVNTQDVALVESFFSAARAIPEACGF